MTEFLPANQPSLSTSEPRSIPQSIDTRISPTDPTAAPKPDSTIRNGHLNLDTFSPVNQNGSFAFDRVLRSGEVHKRTRKTKVSQRLLCRSQTFNSSAKSLAMEIILPRPPTKSPLSLQVSDRRAPP